MEMGSNAKPNRQSPAHLALNESYWKALFEQEETANLSNPTDNQEGLDEITTQSIFPTKTSPHDAHHNGADSGWQLALDYFHKEETVELQVKGYNKGGLLVYWNGLQGFVPASQLANFPHFHMESERRLELRRRQNQHLTLKIIELSPEDNRLIFSERAALIENGSSRHLLEEIQAGDLLTGQVTNLTDFGAFVDLGGVEGLIHISELSWRRVEHPSDIVKPGEEVKVLVLSVNHAEKHIALSRKQLRHDPWLNVEERYKPGQLIEGVISNVVSFGAFALVEEGLEGLIHISELAEGTFLHPQNVVQKGDQIMARILHVDSRERRLSLSLRGISNPILPNK